MIQVACTCNFVGATYKNREAPMIIAPTIWRVLDVEIEMGAFDPTTSAGSVPAGVLPALPPAPLLPAGVVPLPVPLGPPDGPVVGERFAWAAEAPAT